ncbi:chemotaxis protein CheC [Halobacillus amylolyticus]|uniref:Chemotaxis protein CheC n=1 Tax=Halobacillus amylolyticus TaxID=2932259 RepID=A0ABY4HG70_9BACI|nr:chemotaxis protein CheC [Halobacillus amylolyticus]UOR13898.1 chemotaxis protein CheC [Halobacillus amylolyticus]
MEFSEKFTSFHLDVLKEIGNIGAGNAATSLSKLLHKKIDMHVPTVRLVDFQEVMELAGGSETRIVSIMLRLSGDAPGNMFFILTPTQSERFVSQITGITSFNLDDTDPPKVAFSALQELGNILAGSYLSALSDLTNLDLQPSVPSLTVDMAGSVLSFGLIELAQVSDVAIVIETSLSEKGAANESIEGHFFLIPDPPSYNTLFASLGVSGHE